MDAVKCQICGAECNLTKHHLIPQVKCHNKYSHIKNSDENIIWICRQCHDAIHATYTENELKTFYNTLDSLLAAPELQKFINWRKQHQHFSGSAKTSNRKRH